GDEVNNVPRKEYAEAELDDGTASINLSELATIELHDDDGSEKLTVRITDLPEGFSVSKGELLTANETGEGRVWLLTEEQYNSAVIDAPHNFSGDVTYTIQPVTTENDGDSNTMDPID